MKNAIVCLLIDDDPDDHVIFGMATADTHIPVQCTYFYDCRDAVAYLGKPGNPLPDYIFLDLNIPGTKGPECILQLREALGEHKSQIIIYSNIISKDLVTSLTRWGASSVLQKAISIQALTEELNVLFA